MIDLTPLECSMLCLIAQLEEDLPLTEESWEDMKSNLGKDAIKVAEILRFGTTKRPSKAVRETAAHFKKWGSWIKEVGEDDVYPT